MDKVVTAEQALTDIGDGAGLAVGRRLGARDPARRPPRRLHDQLLRDGENGFTEAQVRNATDAPVISELA